jgi:trimeric autotransporter adhesin
MSRSSLWKSWCVIALLHLSAATSAFAQCSGWTAGPFVDQIEGVNGAVRRAITWDPPGGVGPLLIIAGEFTTAGGVAVNRIAAWDGAAWHALGTGLDARADSLAVFNDQLIVGGMFNNAGGVAVNKIARWDGTSWSALGTGLTGGNGCAVLGIFNGELIAGGAFTAAGGVSALNIARWNGSNWNSLGPAGSGTNTAVLALQVFNSELAIGGSFTTAGGLTATRIARWNGGSWGTFGGGFPTGPVFSLAILNGELVAAGLFDTPGEHVARWNGSSWINMGGLNLQVNELIVYNGQLIAGGFFTSALGNGDYIAFWTGSNWQSLGGGTTNQLGPDAFTIYNGNLIVGGNISSAGGVLCGNICKWNGSAYSTLDSPTPQVFAFGTFFGQPILAGNFVQSTPSATQANNVASFNGSGLGAFGTGTNGAVRAVESFVYPGLFGDNELILGGEFTTAGGVGANRIARWQQDPIQAFPPPAWEAMGSGFSDTVFAIRRFNGTTYAAGAFTTAGGTLVNRIARWNETSDLWQTVTTGTNGTVRALRQTSPANPLNVEMIVAGEFTTAGGVAANRIARWVQSTVMFNEFWATMGSGFTDTVHAVERHNNQTYAGGAFLLSGGTSVLRIGRWTGSAWEQVGAGFNGTVLALKSSGGFLYAAGDFTMSGSTPVNRIARWDGTSWQPVDNGAASTVFALGSHNGEVLAGGIFPGVDNPQITSPAFARFLETGAPWISSTSSSSPNSCGGTMTLTVTPAAGYTGLSFAWQKDGAPMSNGITPYGTTISGATTATLTLSSINTHDQASYTCVVSNGCGSATSGAISPSVSGCPVCGDTNADGNVNVDDLLDVINGWGLCPAFPAPCPGDVAPPGGDGIVNVDDLLGVINTWAGTGGCQ